MSAPALLQKMGMGSQTLLRMGGSMLRMSAPALLQKMGMGSQTLLRMGGSMLRVSHFRSPSGGAVATHRLSPLTGFGLPICLLQQVRSLPVRVPSPVSVSTLLKDTCRPVLFPCSCCPSLMLTSLSSCHLQPPLSSLQLHREVRFLQLLIHWSSFLRLEGKKSSVPLVFLSFRGPDTRTGFANFLYKSLVAVGVPVFWDDDGLQYGKPIEKELIKAIRTCRILIPIISKQYVESRSCNLELTEMMNCHKEHGSLVFPIYYKVNLADVGRQSGKFGEDLRKHAMRYSLEEVSRWMEALTAVVRIGGWMSQNIADGHEFELVEMVIVKVLSEYKMMLINQLPTIFRSVYVYILEKKRRETERQVFLVFQGEDIEYGLADYLRVSLEVAGISVFRNDDPSLIGKDIAHEIFNAIEKSKICIPIVDENFYSSYSCLEALTQMIEYEETIGQKVYPIFMVEPSQVRHVSLFQHLEGRSTYEQWEQALKKLASNRGWVSKNIANGKLGVLVKQVVTEVSSLLNNP